MFASSLSVLTKREVPCATGSERHEMKYGQMRWLVTTLHTGWHALLMTWGHGGEITVDNSVECCGKPREIRGKQKFVMTFLMSWAGK